MAEYRLPPAAERDLEGIWKYTRAEWGVEQAERYTDLLTAAFQLLAESPKSAPACDHIRGGYRRRNVEWHMIYLRITDYGIAIIRVLHERMDAQFRLRSCLSVVNACRPACVAEPVGISAQPQFEWYLGHIGHSTPWLPQMR
jgi:toxin ParE1/3/4